MVVGGFGFPQSAYGDVELIDLIGQGRTCNKLPNLDQVDMAAVGTYFDRSPIVCGGFKKGDYLSACYRFQVNIIG